MFLVKCKCKCTFTLLSESALNDLRLYCPNCKRKINLHAYTSVAEHQDLPEQVESVSFIPDNAKITVTFDT